METREKEEEKTKHSETKKEKFRQIGKFIQTNQLLGKGSFGKVYKGFFKEDYLKMVAVKVIPIKANMDLKSIERLKREIDLLKRINHPNIIKKILFI